MLSLSESAPSVNRCSHDRRARGAPVERSWGRKGLAWARLQVSSRGVHQRRDPPRLPALLGGPSRAPSFNRSFDRPVGIRAWREYAVPQLSTVDPSARASMKNAANCDT